MSILNRKPKRMSLFDRATWAFIGWLAKESPDAAINLMGGGNPSEQLAKAVGRHWDPRPRGVSSRQGKR